MESFEMQDVDSFDMDNFYVLDPVIEDFDLTTFDTLCGVPTVLSDEIKYPALVFSEIQIDAQVTKLSLVDLPVVTTRPAPVEFLDDHAALFDAGFSVLRYSPPTDVCRSSFNAFLSLLSNERCLTHCGRAVKRIDFNPFTLDLMPKQIFDNLVYKVGDIDVIRGKGNYPMQGFASFDDYHEVHVVRVHYWDTSHDKPYTDLWCEKGKFIECKHAPATYLRSGDKLHFLSGTYSPSTGASHLDFVESFVPCSLAIVCVRGVFYRIPSNKNVVLLCRKYSETEQHLVTSDACVIATVQSCIPGLYYTYNLNTHKVIRVNDILRRPADARRFSLVDQSVTLKDFRHLIPSKKKISLVWRDFDSEIATPFELELKRHASPLCPIAQLYVSVMKGDFFFFRSHPLKHQSRVSGDPAITSNILPLAVYFNNSPEFFSAKMCDVLVITSRKPVVTYGRVFLSYDNLFFCWIARSTLPETVWLFGSSVVVIVQPLGSSETCFTYAGRKYAFSTNDDTAMEDLGWHRKRRRWDGSKFGAQKKKY